MPTYEYKCSECGHKFDVFHKMIDSSSRECPQCGGKAERLIGSGAGIIFKGPGFYATDYAKGGSGDEAGSCPAGKCCCDKS
ncbi:MAG: zinc ribbon domain-containing protein [Candidatus Aegiribacteria sp.]|nr:zinc ribbon domain-containing protein [Candidatus Aegiribacteria sp.]MBD3294033.1 zinc ribbon domain-containing protein [Candidatus Fermentibacteria bacterium]